MNWPGKPLVSVEIIVNLIANTTTEAGLRVEANLDDNTYPKGIKVTDDELDEVRIRRSRFHGDWNYRIMPTEAAG